MSRRAVVISVALCAFFAGYGVVAKAYPSPAPFGTPEFRGYFSNTYDTQGGYVLPPNYNGEAFPSTIDTANEFISFIENNLNNGNAQQKTGAAFIVNTMIGVPHTSATRPPNAGMLTDWRDRIHHAENLGRITWRTNASYSVNSYYQGVQGGGGTNDDAFYDDVSSAAAMIFRNDAGQIAYMIKWQCANPVGNPGIAGLTNPDFTVTGRSTATDPTSGAAITTIRTGQTVRFTHYLRNSGPSWVPNLAWTIRASAGGPVLQSGSNDWGVGEASVAPSENYVVPAGTAAGTNICRLVTYTPANESGGSGASTPACVTVVADYALIPSVSKTASTAQQGDTVTFTYSVTNSGPGANNPLTVCKAVGKVHPPGSPLPEEFVDRTSDSGQTPPGLSCPASFAGNNTPVTVGTENYVVGALAPGTTICRSLVINPYNGTGGTFRASAETCIVIAKTPFVHFMGGDVWAGGGFIQPSGTCTTNTNAKITTSAVQSAGAGSVVEYAAFALSSINKFGSGSRPLNNSADFADPGRMLSFANNTTTIGNFGAPQHCINDYAATYEASPAISGTVNLATVGSGSRHATGSLTVSGTVPAGGKIALLADGDVTIDNNINYIGATPSYSSATQIPSLVIIAKGDIRVAPNVTNLDGVFISRATFYTCYPKPSPPSVSTCNNLLTVNGSVIANDIDLYRTSGADGATPATRRLPAELFNFSPEVLLNNVLTGSALPALTTSDSRELPPRF